MAQINKPTDYFNTVLYTGNGSTQSITGVNFQTDWVWIKRRNGSGYHILTDAVRGVNSQLYSNDSIAEGTLTNNIQSFDSDGFTLGTNSDVNGSSDTYASWSWLASNTTASNTDGSITSNVSANTTSGFSIVSYTGTGANATVGHGLGVAPKMVIIKNRSDGYDWIVYNQNIGNTGFLRLNTTAAYDTGINMFQNTDSTSSLFYVSSHGAVNASGNNFIAYCFADKKGFSKFGSYVGNGSSTDGTFVYTGFSPSFLILKRVTDSIGSWTMYDNKRHTYNPNGEYLLANDSGAAVAFDNVDFLSNGFKLRAGFNNASSSYIYMCFAENPLVGTNNIPATAR